MKKMGLFGFAALLLLALGPYGCSDEASCVDLCEEGQAGDCTSVNGNCNDFCEAAFGVEDDSGCGDERETYQDCLESNDDVCEAGCGAEETDWTECLATYCLTNADNADRQTLVETTS
jgi:hypothetical protein